MKSEPIQLGIKCVVKLPGSCGVEFAFVSFQNTDNSNENAMEDALLKQWVHIFLFYIWLPISRIMLSDYSVCYNQNVGGLQLAY